MEKGYDKGIDLYCRDITNHYHYKTSPHSQLLDHENLEKIMLCVFHDKDAPTVNPLAPCQNALQENHAGNVPDNLLLGYLDT